MSNKTEDQDAKTEEKAGAWGRGVVEYRTEERLACRRQKSRLAVSCHHAIAQPEPNMFFHMNL